MTNSRNAMLKEQPWILVLIGVVLAYLGTGGGDSDGSVVLLLVGVLVAAAGIALWVVKVLRS